MKIEFSRSGGFAAAMRQSIEIDTADLTKKEAEDLVSLVSKADLANLAKKEPGSPQPDAFHYRIRVSDQGLNHVASTSDADMPASLQPLIDWLSDRASRNS